MLPHSPPYMGGGGAVSGGGGGGGGGGRGAAGVVWNNAGVRPMGGPGPVPTTAPPHARFIDVRLLPNKQIHGYDPAWNKQCIVQPMPGECKLFKGFYSRCKKKCLYQLRNIIIMYVILLILFAFYLVTTVMNKLKRPVDTFGCNQC